MLGVARRTDERGYPEPLPETLRTRLTAGWVVLAAVAGSFVVLVVAVGGSAAWWAVAATVLVSLASGLIAGLAFASKERDFVVPTPIAAGVVAFALAIVVPLLLWGVFLFVALAVTHTGG